MINRRNTDFTVEKEGIGYKYILRPLKPKGPVIILYGKNKEGVFAYHYFRIYYSDGTIEYGSTNEAGEYEINKSFSGDPEDLIEKIELLLPTYENPFIKEASEEPLPLENIEANTEEIDNYFYESQGEDNSQYPERPDDTIELILMDIYGKSLPGIPCIIERDGQFLNIETDQDGKIKDRISSIKFDSENFGYEEHYDYEYEPLPAFLLRNRADGGDGPLQRGDSREKLVKYLQESLIALGFIPDDAYGTFGKNTERIVKEFQNKNIDYNGKALDVDGMVGPRTADCINRLLAGIWFPKYETDTRFLEEVGLITVTPAFLNSNGLPLVSSKGKIIKLMIHLV